MSQQRSVIAVTEHLSPRAMAWLRERCEVVQCSPDDPTFGAVLERAEGMIVRTYTRIDEVLLTKAPRLRVVGRAGTGLDNIDVAACRARGIDVVYTPDANTQAVVEYVLCLMCDAMRPRAALTQPVTKDQWNRLRSETVGRREIGDLTLGILGLGRVGKRLANAAQHLAARLIYNDLLDIPQEQRHGARPVAVEELFEQSDVLSIHIDGRASNRGFVGEQLITRMKPEIVFTNTSRGFVVDNAPLAAFLQNHPNATAMLDVHKPEPFDSDYPLLNLPNARLYPHLASRTEKAMENMSWVVRDVIAVLEGRKAEFLAP